MATVPEAHEPEGGTRIWAIFPNLERAARAARALEHAGIDPERITVAEDPGTSEGPVSHEREHREGTRIVTGLGTGALLGASSGALLGAVLALVMGTGTTGLTLFTIAGALFAGGAGAFIGGLGSLRAAALDHRSSSTDEEPGGAGVEVRADGILGRSAERILRRQRPTALVTTDAFGRPLRDVQGPGPNPRASPRSGSRPPRDG